MRTRARKIGSKVGCKIGSKIGCKVGSKIAWAAMIATTMAATCALTGLERRAHADEPVTAGERILGIDSEVHVLPDGSLRVLETIRIRSAGQQFKHGLQREFPQTYAGPLGSRSQVGFRVEEVLRDGDAEPFALRRVGRDAVIRAGDRDVLLPPGDHTYRITYVTDRQLGYFADHDELYWQAVGTGWRLPIDQATATVELPPAAQGQIRAVDAYIGVKGARERAKRALFEPDRALFVAGRVLNPGEGLTVVVAWPKGIVRAPTAQMRFGWWLHDNRDAEVAIFGILLLMIFVRTARQRLRGTNDGTARAAETPTYDGLASTVSPCLLRYVVRGGFDDGSLPVAILDMAERGCVAIRQTGAHYRVERTDKPVAALPPEEQSAAQALFAEKNQVELAPIDRKRLTAASEALKWDLDRLAPRYLADGRTPAAWGVLLSLVIVGVVFGIGSGDWHIAVFVGGAFSGFAFAFFALTGWLARLLTGRELKRASGGAVAMAVIAAASMAIPASAMGSGIGQDSSPLAVILALGVLFLGYRAVRLRRLRNRAGEALYQGARRARRGNVAVASSTGAEAFSRLLPYALALDAVTAWEAGLGDLPPAPDSPVIFYPSWYYRDPSWNQTGPAWQWSSFTDGFSSMTSKAAAPPPGSSSGSSGSSGSSSSSSGGSSGGDGGGGGGGGGGW